MTAKRIAIVVNPVSGNQRGLMILDQIAPVFSAAGYEWDVYATQHAGHAREIARTLSVDQYDRLCVIGGDGTLHEIVSGLMERALPVSVPVGLIPAGTGNDVAQHFGISDPVAAARRIVSGRTGLFDVVHMETGGGSAYCVTLVGWVGVADINCTAERLRRLGSSRYAIAALWHILFARRRRARLVLDDQTLDDDFLLVAACNTVFSGWGMRLAPRARTDDGRMDVVIVRRASCWQMLRLFARVFSGSHVDMSAVEYHQVRSLSILTEERGPLDVDGEIWAAAAVTLRTIPGAIRIFF